MRGSHRVTRVSRMLGLYGAMLFVVVARGTGQESQSLADSGKKATAEISGRILDRETRPVRGATIRLHRYEAEKHRWLAVKEAIQSGKEGAFRFQGLSDDFYMVVAEKSGYAKGLHSSPIEDGENATVNVVLKPPASAVIELRDRDGKPVAGARLREFRSRGVNGECYLPQLWLEAFSIQRPVSDASGRLTLPPLPEGDIVSVTIDHPHLAPVSVTDVVIRKGTTENAQMVPGIPLRLTLTTSDSIAIPAEITVNLFHDPFSHASTRRICTIPFDPEGRHTLAVESGRYSYLRLEQNDYYITPEWSPNLKIDETLRRIAPGRNDAFRFAAHRKVQARGRVIDAETGRPMSGKIVMGAIPNRDADGKTPAACRAWYNVAFAETDAKGEYTLSLTAGRARVSFEGQDYLPDEDYTEIDVARDGSTVIPDIRLSPVPKVKGIVRNPDGSPSVKAVVRFRGPHLFWMQPVATDLQGQFELQPAFIPLDQETEQRVVVHPIVAFDPHRPLAGRVDVQVGKPADVVLKLEPHEPGWLLSEFKDELTDWQRGKISAERAEEIAAITLKDKPAPELDGVLWLNTDKPALKLADLRGKYVLLDFWTTGCGPCHADFPSVNLLHEFYKDRGLVVIGMHDNSVPAEAVKRHVEKIGLPFPNFVDYPDGRTVTAYQRHGIANSVPSYVLIGPDGNVLLDDRTIPHPSLRSYKMEIIRQKLLAPEGKTSGSD